MGTKKRIWLVAAALAATNIVGLAPAAQAATCDHLLEGDTDTQACAAAASLVCKIVAKGQPCLD